jgi:hypothetical protein
VVKDGIEFKFYEMGVREDKGGDFEANILFNCITREQKMKN